MKIIFVLFFSLFASISFGQDSIADHFSSNRTTTTNFTDPLLRIDPLVLQQLTNPPEAQVYSAMESSPTPTENTNPKQVDTENTTRSELLLKNEFLPESENTYILPISQAGLIAEVTITLDIVHPQPEELTISLTDPSNLISVILHHNSPGYPLLDTIKGVYDSEKQPVDSLSSFTCREMEGNWKLTIKNNSVNAGLFNYGKLEIAKAKLAPLEIKNATYSLRLLVDGYGSFGDAGLGNDLGAPFTTNDRSEKNTIFQSVLFDHSQNRFMTSLDRLPGGRMPSVDLSIEDNGILVSSFSLPDLTQVLLKQYFYYNEDLNEIILIQRYYFQKHYFYSVEKYLNISRYFKSGNESELRYLVLDNNFGDYNTSYYSFEGIDESINDIGSFVGITSSVHYQWNYKPIGLFSSNWKLDNNITFPQNLFEKGLSLYDHETHPSIFNDSDNDGITDPGKGLNFAIATGFELDFRGTLPFAAIVAITRWGVDSPAHVQSLFSEIENTKTPPYLPTPVPTSTPTPKSSFLGDEFDNLHWDTNIGALGIATAESSKSGREPRYAIDNDTSTPNQGWSPDSELGWWQVEFVSEISIYKIEIYPSVLNPHDMFPKFKILSSLTGEFSGEEVVVVEENQWPDRPVVAYEISPINTRFLRIVPTEPQPWTILQEFRVYPAVEPTPIPTDTPTPTETPVPTSTPTPTATPTPTIAQIQVPVDSVMVTDDLYSVIDLIGNYDLDSPDKKSLAIWWNFGEIQPTSIHVYVKTDEGEPVFIYAMDANDNNHFEWLTPEFNHSYKFRIYALVDNIPVKYLDTMEAVRYYSNVYNLYDPIVIPEGAHIANLSLHDDETNPIVLKEGSDIDLGEAKISIGWHYDSTKIMDSNIEVYIKEEGNDLKLLGYAKPENRRFTWSRDSEDVLAEWRQGPAFNRSYQFVLKYPDNSTEPETHVSDTIVIKPIIRTNTYPPVGQYGEINLTPGKVFDLQCSPQSELFAVATSSGVYCFDTDNLELVHWLNQNKQTLSIGFSHDGCILSVGASNGDISVYDLSTGTLIDVIQQQNSYNQYLFYDSIDGCLYSFTKQKNQINVIDIDIKEIENHLFLNSNFEECISIEEFNKNLNHHFSFYNGPIYKIGNELFLICSNYPFYDPSPRIYDRKLNFLFSAHDLYFMDNPPNESLLTFSEYLVTNYYRPDPFFQDQNNFPVYLISYHGDSNYNVDKSYDGKMICLDWEYVLSYKDINKISSLIDLSGTPEDFKISNQYFIPAEYFLCNYCVNHSDFVQNSHDLVLIDSNKIKLIDPFSKQTKKEIYFPNGLLRYSNFVDNVMISQNAYPENDMILYDLNSEKFENVGYKACDQSACTIPSVTMSFETNPFYVRNGILHFQDRDNKKFIEYDLSFKEKINIPENYEPDLLRYAYNNKENILLKLFQTFFGIYSISGTDFKPVDYPYNMNCSDFGRIFPFHNSIYFLRRDNTLTIYTMQENVFKHIALDPSITLQHAYYNEEMDKIFLCDTQGRIFDYNRDTEQMTEIWHAYDQSITHMNISEDLRYLFTGCLDGRNTMYDFQSQEMLFEFPSHARAIISSKFDQEKNILYTVSQDGNIRQWELNSIIDDGIITDPTPTMQPDPTSTPEPSFTPTPTPKETYDHLKGSDLTIIRRYDLCTLADITHISGGFDQYPGGEIEIVDLPGNPKPDSCNQGLLISLDPGEVELLQFPMESIEDYNFIFIRARIHTEGDSGSVILAALDGEFDGSIGTNLTNKITDYSDGYHYLTMVYEHPRKEVYPLFQAANLGSSNSLKVYLDDLEIYGFNIETH